MKLWELQSGCAIELQVVYNNNTYEFSSKVLGIKKEVLILAEILVDGKKLNVTKERGINIIFQMLNKLYIWNDVKIETILYKGHYYYRINDSDIESKQYNRRGAFRLYIGNSMPIEVYLNEKKNEYSVKIKDISETGFGFVSKEDLLINKKVEFAYQTNEALFNLYGFIVRKAYDPVTKSYSYGCKFPEFYNELGSFIIKEQAKRRRTTA